MATKIEAPSGEKVTREDTFRINPDDVKLGRNSRGIKSFEKDDVRKLAVLIAEQGQQVPAIGHRDPETKQVVVDGGFKRHAAVKMLRDGFTANTLDGDRTFHDPNATLWIAVDTSVKTEKDAFLKSIRENLRDEVSDVEEAYAHGVLRDEYGMVNAEIAREYGYTNQNRVDKLEKLLALPDDVIQLVRERKLAMSVAVDDLFDVDPAIRATIIQNSTDDKGKVQGPRVREYLRGIADGTPVEQVAPVVEPPKPGKRAKKAAESRESDDAPPKSIKRTVKNALDFLDYYSGLEDGNETGKALCETFARWLRGSLKTNTKLEQALDGLKSA